MRHDTHGRGRVQLARARRELLAEPELCLGKLLPREQVAEALLHHAVVFRRCLYTTMVTLWMFLCQALSADQSCRAAVSRLLAFVSLAAGDANRLCCSSSICWQVALEYLNVFDEEPIWIEKKLACGSRTC